jgi:DNA gyrase subunit A
MQVTKKTGNIVAIKAVLDTDQLMIINRSGVVIRTAVSNLPVLGRATQGVRVIRIDEDDSIADVALVPGDDDEDENVNEILNDEASEELDVTEGE